MSYIKQKDEGVPADNLEGTIAPDQVAYGDPDNSGKIKGSNNFTFIDESGGSGPTVQLRGDKPTMTIRDDTDATDYSTTLQQSGASLYVSAIRSGAETDNQELIRMQRTEIAVNDDAENLDFRIEGQTDTNLVRTDASLDKVTIGGAPGGADSKLTVNSGSSRNTLDLISNDATSNGGPNLRLYRDSGSPAPGDTIGQIAFNGKDDGGNDTEYARISVQVNDETGGTEDGWLRFGASYAGNMQPNLMTIRGDVPSVVVNEDSADVDFRVEGASSQSLLRTNAAQDNVGVNTNPASDVESLHIKGSGADTIMTRMESTDTDGSAGPILEMYRNPGEAGQAGDILGQILFTGPDDGGSKTTYANVLSKIHDPVNGSEDASLEFDVIRGGTSRTNLRIRHSEVIINEDSEDVDFRVESNTNTYALSVDAGQDNVGIGTAPDSSVERLHVKGTGLSDMVVFEGTSEGSGSTDGPDLILYNSATPTGPNKFIGRFEFRGKNDAAATKAYGSIQTFIQDETASTEDSLMLFKTFTGGSNLEKLRINLGGTEINSTGNDNLNFDVKTGATTSQQSFFKTYNNSAIADRYTEVLRGSRTLTSTPVSVTEDRCYGSNIVTDTGASVVNLPEAIPGMHLQVVNKNISGITIAPAVGETINGSASSYSVQHGWVIAKVICIADGEWVVAEAN